MKLDREHTTKEAILLINNDEGFYDTVKNIETVTHLGEFFRIFIAPRIRQGIKQECYTLHDVNLGDLLESIESRIGE
jgi:hypothetical protein